jgi:hypothetical protein
MYARSEYLTCTSIRVSYMYIRSELVLVRQSEHLTYYTSVLSILHVRPFLVSYMHVRLSILHIRLFEYFTCTSCLSILHIRPS